MITNNAGYPAVTAMTGILILAAFCALCYLQIKLSRNPRRAPGLLLPAASFFLSVLAVLAFTLFSATGMIKTGSTSTVTSGKYAVTVYSDGAVDAAYAETGAPVECYSENGALYDRETGELIITDDEIFGTLEALNASLSPAEQNGGPTPSILPLMFFLNLPTLCYLLIYILVRRGLTRAAQLDKIEIQDF